MFLELLVFDFHICLGLKEDTQGFRFKRPPAVSQPERANGNFRPCTGVERVSKMRNPEKGQEKFDSKEFCIMSFGFNDLDKIIMSSGCNFSKCT